MVQTVSSLLVYPVLYLHHKLIDPISCRSNVNPIVLQEAYEDLLSAYIQLQATALYHQETEELIAFKRRYDYQGMLAQVLQRHLGDDEQYLLIDKGSHDGVHDRMVLVYKDMLVGRVYQVFPLYSKCLLLTDERCKIGASCAQTKAQGVTKGTNHTDLLLLEHVSHVAVMQKGDIILSSGDGLIFPRGFGIAHVTDFHKDDLLYIVSCSPLIDPHEVRYCYLMQKS